MPSLRGVRESDWDAIAALADVAVREVQGAPTQHAWVSARQAFDGERRHHVAIDGDVVVGYGAVEAGPADGSYRVFVVADWSTRTDVVEALFDRLLADLGAVGATHAWLREYANDDRLVAFFTARGFERGEEYDREGATLVNLDRAL